MITTQIELDVSPGGIAPVIHVSQYDTGSRTLQFNLIATAGDLILPTGTKAEIRGTKPDGNGFSYDALINGKTVTADVTEQMTAAAGKAVCEIVLYTGMPAREDAEASSDFTQLCTANFILFVERAALDKDTVKSGSEIKQLITVIDRTDELLAAAETMDDAKESIRQMTEKLVHFYEKRGRGMASDTWDIQKIDMGIALCHFELGAVESGLCPVLYVEDPELPGQDGLIYIASFKNKKMQDL